MREMELFEYAVIRVVPRVERGEFLNVGVVLYSAKQKFLDCKYFLDKNKLKSFSPEIDIELVEKGLDAFDRICRGGSEGGAIGKLDVASRFRWLTAKRSTIIQCSEVHPGFCNNATNYLERLLKEYVY